MGCLPLARPSSARGHKERGGGAQHHPPKKQIVFFPHLREKNRFGQTLTVPLIPTPRTPDLGVGHGSGELIKLIPLSGIFPPIPPPPPPPPLFWWRNEDPPMGHGWPQYFWRITRILRWRTKLTSGEIEPGWRLDKSSQKGVFNKNCGMNSRMYPFAEYTADDRIFQNILGCRMTPGDGDGLGTSTTRRADRRIDYINLIQLPASWGNQTRLIYNWFLAHLYVSNGTALGERILFRGFCVQVRLILSVLVKKRRYFSELNYCSFN